MAGTKSRARKATLLIYATCSAPKPGSSEGYIFEKQALVLGDARGYADVFKRGAFAWENKAPGKNLDAALKQLLN